MPTYQYGVNFDLLCFECMTLSGRGTGGIHGGGQGEARTWAKEHELDNKLALQKPNGCQRGPRQLQQLQATASTTGTIGVTLLG